MSKLLVIDGGALINTHFYGAIPGDIRRDFYALGDNTEEKDRLLRERFSFDSEGNCTELLSSLTQTILSYKRALDTDAVVVCLDGGRNETFRKGLLPEYKAQRSASPFALKNTSERLGYVLKEVGIKACRSKTYEADDLAGSIINKFKDECEEVYFVTRDHDWLQMIDRNVLGLYISDDAYRKQMENRTLCHFNEKLSLLEGAPGRLVAYNRDICKNEEGVYPEEIAFKKALAGDTSDNYKGIPQIGEKAAVKLASTYHTPENLYLAIQNGYSHKDFGIKKEGFDNLASNPGLLNLMMEISTIKPDIPINASLSNLICNPTKEDLFRAARAFNFCDKLGFQNRDDGYER